MTLFESFAQLGWEHILDLNGYDHILFVMTLCGVYLPRDWRPLLLLVTAFTVGHSLTLALAVTGVVSVRTELVEFLIPVTIVLTAIGNMLYREASSPVLHGLKYGAAAFFGLIHGLGFSNYLRSLLGAQDDLLTPLLAFNIGVEIGQVLIVAIVLALAWLFVRAFQVPKREWNLILSSSAMGIALLMSFERLVALRELLQP